MERAPDRSELLLTPAERHAFAQRALFEERKRREREAQARQAFGADERNDDDPKGAA
jgi:hypothetical protein